ncbi:DUF1819 family protein [Marinilactibacillus psychrotolerans]|uniref:DUF1819 family protein n=1 Tax=Marinilactibacillus psychrotolerans TaxID=191770 RepID=UPI001C7DF1EB|nr:DUF1819 family protein [Marinilactibacillus psychrotolerans]GEQ33686.1 hypothetical protein B795N_15680 [Marinilactibacillus psychrotolerans]
MSNKVYSAGLVSQRFWFYEIKQYIEMLNDGKTDKEIKQLSDEINVFGAVSANRAKEIFNAARRRANVLGKEMQELFQKLNIDNQKIVTLISVLMLNDLLLEFMLEVYQVKLQNGIMQLSTTDYKAFFSEKQRTNDVVAEWKPYTYNRLGSAYKNYLLEAGLIRENGNVDIITPKLIDSRVIAWLKSINRLEITEVAITITGGA